ncbi:protein ApaG [mine drainage metagenome]|uniref:Protein ApaG n=1 Tax=mine drainage metagenome TaxID=410659 RepID=A0A1J5RMW6_9ZZZZ
MYSKTTRAITVSVQPVYLDEQSDPARHQFVWAYRVRIVNTGFETVRLLRRHWRITDAYGRRQTVDGEGVVGEQPVLEPGGAFDYTSGTPLPTPSGFMEGHYLMETRGGERFEVEIPAFSLDGPEPPRALN